MHFHADHGSRTNYFHNICLCTCFASTHGVLIPVRARPFLFNASTILEILVSSLSCNVYLYWSLCRLRFDTTTLKYLIPNNAASSRNSLTSLLYIPVNSINAVSSITANIQFHSNIIQVNCEDQLCGDVCIYFVVLTSHENHVALETSVSCYNNVSMNNSTNLLWQIKLLFCF